MPTLGLLGPSEPTAPGVFVVFGFCFLLFGLLIASTIGVVRRSGIWARVVTIVAGAALCLTCAGVVLGIPIIVAGARAPMTKPAPSAYA